MPTRHLFLSRRTLLVGVCAATAGCGDRTPEAASALPESPAPRPQPTPAPGAADAAIVTILGDSITAGLGLRTEEALPRQLERALQAAGVGARVRNAGVSGDTTAGALDRVDFSVQDDTDLCVVALGGNDLLQGVPPQRVRDNLAEIIRKLQSRRIGVVLAGMRAPPRYGAYAAEFDRIFPALAETFQIPLYPFLLDGVALDADLNQADGIHPNAAGVRRIASGLAPAVAMALRAPGRAGYGAGGSGPA